MNRLIVQLLMRILGFYLLTLLQFMAVNYVGLLDSAKVGNLIPKIINVIADTLINRPEGRNINLIKVKAEVIDGDGNETIKWVGFTSFSLRDNEMMNNGNMIYLYDDGGTEILYPPDFTSGDSARDDGIYTFKIPIYGDGLVLRK